MSTGTPTEELLIVSHILSREENPGVTDFVVELPYDLRKKSRIRATAQCGQQIGIQLQRGQELLDGQVLAGPSGQTVKIIAAPETVTTVTGSEPLLLLRAAYHLGNRHVPLQVTEQWLRYQHDHVLDDMVVGLGLVVTVEKQPFQPESGAYARQTGHHHGHSHHHEH